MMSGACTAHDHGLPQLDHVGDVKDRRVLARVLVRRNDAVLILNGHVVSSEWHHLGPEASMEVSQRGLLERLQAVRRESELYWTHPCSGS